MAYDEELSLRIRELLGELPGMVEKKMFGGVGLLINGNMACGIHKNNLIVRVGTDQYQAALSQPHTRLFDMTGRPMIGWVMVEPAGVENQADLKKWIMQGVNYAATLPAK